jgi:hypothetical protein
MNKPQRSYLLFLMVIRLPASKEEQEQLFEKARSKLSKEEKT